MTKLNTMYKGVVNSPETYLKENLAAEGAVIYVADGSVFGELPNLAVIGDDQTAETILVKVKRSDGGYDVDRAVEGQKKDWQKATIIARNFTNYDYQQLIDNINILNDDKVDKVEGKGLSTKDYTEAEKTKLKDIEEKANKTEIINDLTTGGADKALSAEQGKELKRQIDTKAKELTTSIDTKVDAVQGKGLSTNDFTTAEQTKLKGIEDEANKTTIINDLTTGGVDKALSAEQGKLLFQNVDDGKLQIANAIIDKGQSGVSNSSSFQELATGIRSIKTGYTVGDIIKPADVKVLSRTEEKAPSKEWEYTGFKNGVARVTVDNQGYVYTGDYDAKVIKLSPNGTKVWEFTGHNNLINGIAVDNQGYVYSADYSGYIMKLSPSGQKIWSFKDYQINALAIDKNNNVYVGNDNAKVIKISSSGQKVWEFTGHTKKINALAVDSQGNIYSGSNDTKVIKISPSGTKVWEFVKGNSIYSIAADDKGYIYTVSSDDKVLKISPQRQIVWEYKETNFLNTVAVDSQGYVYEGGGNNGVVKLSPSGTKIWEFTGHTRVVQSVAVDSQGYVYSGGSDKKVIKLHQNIETILTGYEVLR